MQLFPAPGPWSVLAPIGIKRLSSSNELGAQHVSPHQTTKRKETTAESRVPALFLCHDMMLCHCKIAAKKRGFWMFRTASQLRKSIGEESLGPQEQRDSSKTVDNRKAICYTLLNRITKLKCVNSEVNSVDINPKRGCLNWPCGTMSESP